MSRICLPIALALLASLLGAQNPPAPVEPAIKVTSVDEIQPRQAPGIPMAAARKLIDRSATGSAAYALGPGDELIVRTPELEDYSGDPIQIGQTGQIKLPLIGAVMAGGRTIEQVEAEITERLQEFVKEPQVTVSIAHFNSRPVSVFGSVGMPGVHQLQGPKTLYEVLSMAGGFTNEVGDTVRITRRLENGDIPLDSATPDESGRFSTVEINVADILDMTNPDNNILVMPHDVITVSRADIVYVVGHVPRAGGFVTKGDMSLLEALSLAGGYLPNAKPKKSAILRQQPGSDKRQVIPIDLAQILKGEGEDIVLHPSDILYVPHNAWKDFGLGMAKSAAGAAAGAAIYSGIRGY